MSQWMTDCFLGKLAKVKKHVTKNHRILDRRETPLRINGLMYAVVGYKLGVNNPQRLAVIKYLIKKGTPVDGRDFVGHTALHQGPDSIEICLLKFKPEMASVQGSSTHFDGLQGDNSQL